MNYWYNMFKYWFGFSNEETVKKKKSISGIYDEECRKRGYDNTKKTIDEKEKSVKSEVLQALVKEQVENVLDGVDNK